jgi:hypothetical protein
MFCFSVIDSRRLSGGRRTISNWQALGSGEPTVTLPLAERSEPRELDLNNEEHKRAFIVRE